MNQKENKSKNKALSDHAIASAMHETAARYGSGSAEFIKAYFGKDNSTGQVFARNLKKISEGKINPGDFEKNIKQQAGYSAEVASTAKKNANAIINKTGSQFSRSDDLPEYGVNHKIVDIVEKTPNGKTITSQMKFISDQHELLKKIACGEGGGKNDLSRYLEVDKLEVPSEQVKQMKEICQKEHLSLQRQAQSAKERGDIKLYEKKSKQAQNYKKLESKITDAGMTTDEAIQWRLNPGWKTTKAMASVSHDAGIQGAKLGAAIGGGISAILNAWAVYSEDKKLSDALKDTAQDALRAGAVGYGTAFAGTAIKAGMQQSSAAAVRQLSNTALPTMVVSTCVATFSSIKSYVEGDISEFQLSEQMSMTAFNMLSGSAFAALGQIAIPIPVLGGLIGGMVGYAITRGFHDEFFLAIKDVKLSENRKKEAEAAYLYALELNKKYQQSINELFEKKLIQVDDSAKAMFTALNNKNLSPDNFCTELNKFATLLGKKISINNMADFDAIMLSDRPLSI